MRIVFKAGARQEFRRLDRRRAITGKQRLDLAPQAGIGTAVRVQPLRARRRRELQGSFNDPQYPTDVNAGVHWNHP
jgi:hypothetical protein